MSTKSKRLCCGGDDGICGGGFGGARDFFMLAAADAAAGGARGGAIAAAAATGAAGSIDMRGGVMAPVFTCAMSISRRLRECICKLCCKSCTQVSTVVACGSQEPRHGLPRVPRELG